MLKESQRSSLRLSNMAPSLKLFSKIFFPIFYHSTSVDATPQDLTHAMEDMGGHGLPHNFEYPVWARGTTKYYLSNLKNRLSSKTVFFSRCQLCHVFLPACSHSPPLAAICRHLQPLDWLQVAAGASCRKRPLKQVHGCSHLQPLAATWVAASGRKWPQVAASGSSKRVAASGRKWPQVAASGRKWPQVAAFGQINFDPQSNLSA